jgi:7,8-dihydropterin-6-yl-methyl-4-(beta-D-ribofuranosyl)aminobenzene 5'-phosphate synthase
MKITVLVENSVFKPNTKSVSSKFGLSLYIEYAENKILFDLGPSTVLVKNAIKLGVDLSDIDYVFLSHGHFDHGRGLKTFFASNNKAKIYIHKYAPQKYYANILGLIKIYVGLNKKIIKKFQDRFIFIDKDTQIVEGINVFANFSSTFTRPDTKKSLVEKINNKFIVDEFKHEMVLALKENDGTVLFTGCSHSGIVNMVNDITDRLNNPQIKAVVGGFHTLDKHKNDDYIKNLIEALAQINTVFYTGHCTGRAIFKFMNAELGSKIRTMNTGQIIEI